MKEKKIEYKCLGVMSDDKLSNLLEAYKVNPYNARVLFFNTGRGSFKSRRLVLFEEGNDFSFVCFEKSFGVSKTNRMYSREKKIKTLKYKSGKFYIIGLDSIKQATYQLLHDFFSYSNGMTNMTDSSSIKDFITKYLIDRFSWLRYVFENDYLQTVSFNTIKRNKLYSLTKAVRHVGKIPYSVFKRLTEESKTFKSKSSGDFFDGYAYAKTPLQILNEFKFNYEVLKNVENVSYAFICNQYFSDTCRMAKTLGETVNCSWSLRRLKEVHDEWSEKITNIVLSTEREYDLNIREVYHRFADFSGFNLLTTNIQMLGEGMRNHHCVGTYITRVNNGQCAIFSIEGYTLEVFYGKKHYYESNDKPVLFINQFRGKYNIQAPNNLVNMVNSKIDEFNEMLKREEQMSYVESTIDL